MVLDTPAGWARPIGAKPAPSHRLPAALDDASKDQVYQRWRMGVSADVMAEQLGLAPAVIERAINEVRARRILEQELEFIYHPSFDGPDAAEVILAPLPAASGEGPTKSSPPARHPTYLTCLEVDDPLLSREQEAHLFRQMNYLKFRAAKIRDRLNPGRAKALPLLHIEHLLAQALAVRNLIIRANLRLVVSIVKKRAGPMDSFFEMVSDGNISLIRAVEKFDFSRGFKFSTYASWSIMNNLAHKKSEQRRSRDRVVVGRPEVFDAVDHRTAQFDHEGDRRHHREVVHAILGRLDAREQKILALRFGIGGDDTQTLKQLSKVLGISRERVRQIESRALKKLRQLAIDQRIDPDSI
jgi:RNA polymerase primary sigma factor